VVFFGGGISLQPGGVMLGTNLADELSLYNVIKLQARIRVFLARRRVLKQVRARFEKIFDPRRKRFYYYDTVKDKASWLKPALLFQHDLEDIAPTFTKPEAAVHIQCLVRQYLSKLRIRLLYQEVVMQVKDDQSGYVYYYNPLAGTTLWELPSFMQGRMDHKRKPPRRNKYLSRNSTNSSRKLPPVGTKKSDTDTVAVDEPHDEDDDYHNDSNNDDNDEDEDDEESLDSLTRQLRRKERRRFPR
jgi:hypothetical protein